MDRLRVRTVNENTDVAVDSGVYIVIVHPLNFHCASFHRREYFRSFKRLSNGRNEGQILTHHRGECLGVAVEQGFQAGFVCSDKRGV